MNATLLWRKNVPRHILFLCYVKCFMFENPRKETFWHTSAHVLAQAVKRLYPETKCAIGLAIENGFYYDFDFAFFFSEEHLAAIEAEMKKIVKESLSLQVYEVSKEEALSYMEKENAEADKQDMGQMSIEDFIKNLKL